MGLDLIDDIHDLTKVGPADFTMNFNGPKYQGYVTTKRDTVAKEWVVAYLFRLGLDWDWGNTEEGGKNPNLANVKGFRLWDPGDTPENFVVEFDGRSSSMKWTMEGIDWVDQWGTKTVRTEWFFGNFQQKLTRNVWHEIRFYFKDSSAAGVADGIFEIWIDGNSLGRWTNITTFKSSGPKRPFIIGFMNAWPKSPYNGNNTFEMRITEIEPNKVSTPPAPPPPPPTPTPTPVPPTPTPPAPDYLPRPEFVLFKQKLSEAVK